MTEVTTYPSRTISLVIRRPCTEVYRFLSEPANLSRWTAGVFHAPLAQVDTHAWQTVHNGAAVTMVFTPSNGLGVIDLQVTGREAADRFYHARVFANGDGTELCCTVLQGAEESDAQFASEVEWLRTDLQVLKAFLEAVPA